MHLSQMIHSKLYCTVCEVFLGSKANYALHVLTKEHCENLVKVGKPESINSKSEGTPPDMETPKATPATDAHTKSTSFTPYNFVAGKLYPTDEDLRAIDVVKYGRFWHSLIEAFNEEFARKSEINNTNSTTIPNFGNTITKSLISCEVCNVILTKIVDYEYHVNSPQHILNMKLHGMNVSARFVNSNTNSCVTNAVEVFKNSHEVEQNDSKQLIPVSKKVTLIPFPVLYCDACELLLNTPQQFNTHINGSSHKTCVKKKGKMKVKKVQLPMPNKFYCFSCEVILNSRSQYNEHKTGRKHKIRCTQLTELGFAIPPEEQLPDWNLPKVSPDKPFYYPEFYERFVLLKQQEAKKSSEFKELLMIEGGSESDDYIRILDGTTPTNISGVQNLNTLKSKTIPQHIYRIQSKSLKSFKNCWK